MNSNEEENERCTILSEKAEKTDQGQTDRSQKSISLLLALALVFGNIVGSGIFIAVKETFEVFTSPHIGMVIVFWVSIGIVAIFGGLCYAELGSRIPLSGGDRAYIKEILGDKLSRCFVIFYVFLIRTLVFAAISVTAGKYFLVMINPDSKNSIIEKLLGIIVVIFCYILNCISKTVAMKAGFILTILKISAIVIIVGGGIVYLAKGNTAEWKTPFKLEGFNLSNLFSCIVSILYSYDSFNTIGMVAGDMKNPTRDLPIALIGGMSAVIFVYVMVIVSYCAILGFTVARTSPTIAYSSAVILLGKASPIIAILICCSALGSANGTLYTVASTCASAGFSGELPKLFSLVNRRSRTPILALSVITFITICFSFFNFQEILNYSAFISWIFYFITYLSLWVVKIKTRKRVLENVFQTPYLILIPVQLTCVFMIIMTFYQEPKGCSVFGALFLFVLFVQYIPPKYFESKNLDIAQTRFITFCGEKLGLELCETKDIS